MSPTPGPSAEPPVNAKTAHLKRGRHENPQQGVCVMELASMLAGEPFSDHPKCACPVVAAFLRTYNDGLDDGARDELFPYAAMVVGSAGDRALERRRLDQLLAWAHPRHSRRRRRIAALSAPRAATARSIGRVALSLEPHRRRVEVERLLRLLLGVPAEQPIDETSASPAEA